jgi:hypothetical protein
MNTYINGWGGKAYRELEADRREEAKKENERYRTEQLIIEHTEKATNTKAVEVDGELKYIPIAEAKKLGLI